MRDYRQIDGMIKQASECLHHTYDKGYKQGQADETKSQDVITDKAYYDGYNKGTFEAWDCIKKMCELFTYNKLREIFGVGFVIDVINNFTPQEAIKCIKDHEKKEKEVHVGDEVYNLDPENVRVVTAIYDDDNGHKQAVQICKNGKYAVDRVDTLRKTGKHYDGIESILDQMRAKE